MKKSPKGRGRGPIEKSIVTAPTQPQLNSKVGFDVKMTLDHHPPPHPQHQQHQQQQNQNNNNNNKYILAINDPISTHLEIITTTHSTTKNNNNNINKSQLLMT